MSELSKFINLVIEYGEKLQSTLNKKYKPFIRSICNLENLAKNVDSQNIVLTKEIIIFKLGLQAKSTKSIEVSLVYLHKFFMFKFVDLNVPNFSQEFEIQETTVRKKENANITKDLRYQLLRLLEPLVHFKSHQINNLLFRVYEHLITQPIAPVLIQLNLITPSQIGQRTIYNYFSYRFYIYQEIYTFKEAEFKSINPLSIRNERINQQIEAAFVNHQNLLDLVHKYVGEIVAAVSGAGGKYGLCVICREPADFYCKITKASLCGAECKKRHLQLAQKQYKGYHQAVNLWKQIEVNFEYLLQVLSKKQSKHLLSVLYNLLEKPHIFMIVKRQFRSLIGRHVSSIVSCAFSYKDQSAFQVIYNLITPLAKYFMVESMSSLEHFFKESVLKILQDKRPNFKILIIVFKTLAKIFEYGKTLIQLYVNFDCQFNKVNVIERVMFQISRMAQDKFGSHVYFNKQEKNSIKSSSVALFSIICKGLNEYRLLYHDQIPSQIQEILDLKQKKTNLEKFVHKFNDHWSQGLKTLFNLSMVGLQSQKQIVAIVMSTKGLKKQKVEQFLISQNGKQYIQTFMNHLVNKGQFMGLVQMFRIIPLKKITVFLKYFDEFLLAKQLKSEQDSQNNIQKCNKTTEYVNFLNSSYKLSDLKAFIQKQNIKITTSIEHLYMRCLQTKEPLTLGSHKTFFRHCISQSYLEVFASQLTLLQIPILYLVETNYSQNKIFQIISDLIQICPHANWVQLCLKNIDSNKLQLSSISKQDASLIVSCLQLSKNNAQYISDWSGIMNFVGKLYKAASMFDGKTRQQNITVFSVLQIQQFLLQIGKNSQINFNRLVITLLKIAQQEQIVTKGKQNVFFLQKTFQIIEQNLSKFFENYKSITQQMQNMTKSHKPISSEYSIYLCDMLKQLFVKILKFPISQHIQSKKQIQMVKKTIQISFFTIFESLLQIKIHGSRQVNDFVMNSISMIIMHFYDFQSTTWTFIIQRLVKPSVQSYRQQCLSILQKIVCEKMRLLQEGLEWDLINVCIDIVDRKESKISIQSMHILTDIINILLHKDHQLTLNKKIWQNVKQEQVEHLNQGQKMTQQSPQTQKYQQSSQEDIGGLLAEDKTRKYLIYILEKLIQFISYDCHQGAIQTLFILLRTNQLDQIEKSKNAKKYLTDQEINRIIQKIYSKLQQLSPQLIPRGQKIMNESLFWSVRNKNFGIIKNLQACIIDKYSRLSHTAMKCIKTYISMTNPKENDDWQPIEQTLVKILKNTHINQLARYTKEQSKGFLMKLTAQNYEQEKDQYFEDSLLSQLSLTQFSNKLIIQRMTVQVLPNDLKIIEQLLSIYEQTVQFNNNIEFRCLLWRKGLANANIQSPPDILSLEELISYRIISTYYWSKQYDKIASFTLEILEKYCQASRKWEELEFQSIRMENQASHRDYEFYLMEKNYWEKRRQPLKVIINYMLPKIPKICKKYLQKQKIVGAILQSMKFCEQRTSYIEAVRQLVMIK